MPTPINVLPIVHKISQMAPPETEVYVIDVIEVHFSSSLVRAELITLYHNGLAWCLVLPSYSYFTNPRLEFPLNHLPQALATIGFQPAIKYTFWCYSLKKGKEIRDSFNVTFHNDGTGKLHPKFAP